MDVGTVICVTFIFFVAVFVIKSMVWLIKTTIRDWKRGYTPGQVDDARREFFDMLQARQDRKDKVVIIANPNEHSWNSHRNY